MPTSAVNASHSDEIRTRTATLDRSLSAVVVARQPLRYAEGSDEQEDRPAHVRAASSLAWIRGEIALIQDDANFLAVLRPEHGSARAIALPRGREGRRQFDDARGNKKHKMDLEACVALSGSDGEILLALGSGSRKRRRTIVTIDRWQEPAPRIRVVDAQSLYERLESEAAFAGSDMNIEGALLHGDVIRLFARGNGVARGSRVPCDATCDIPADELLDYLQRDGLSASPEPRNVMQYKLGHFDGTALGFTDAAWMGEHTLYSAAAEASKDAVSDGVVSGSAIGVIAPDGRTRYAVLTDVSGSPLREKVEGLVCDHTVPGRVFIVVDPDDANRPSELCVVDLVGRWAD